VQRVSLGIGLVGGQGTNGSGDIFIAFSTANPTAFQRANFTKVDVLPMTRSIHYLKQPYRQRKKLLSMRW
jgi:L-aminopeptidase/D-esterase-like protein